MPLRKNWNSFSLQFDIVVCILTNDSYLGCAVYSIKPMHLFVLSFHLLKFQKAGRIYTCIAFSYLHIHIIFTKTLLAIHCFFCILLGTLSTWQKSTWRNTMSGIGFGWLLPTKTGMSMNFGTSTLPRMRERRKIEHPIQFFICFSLSFLEPHYLFQLLDL